MNQLLPHFSAWRTLRAGTREVVDAIIAPDSRGPSAGLREALDRWRGAWYWADDAGTRLVLVRPLEQRRPKWALHLLLFVLTILCTLGAGAVLAGGWSPHVQRGLTGALLGASRFFVDVAQGEWRQLLQGWTFAAPLLTILLVHELGHYLAARRYEIDTTPPFFLPIPPSLSPIGSLGAFIRLRSPVLDRRQLLDVGAAGPLAGFVVAVAVLAWGYAISERIPIVVGQAPSYVTFVGQPVFLGESLLTRTLRNWILPGTDAVHLSPPAFAGWVGVFITGLNLLPLSQLDGGHVMYGLLGRRQATLGLLAVVALLVLAQRSPNWYVWVAFALLVGGGRWTHPAVLVPGRALPPGRRWIGWITLVVLGLTFVPYPFHS